MYFEDDQTSSNSPGPPAGGGSSNRGYRNPITDAVVSSIGSFRRGNGNSHGPGRNDRERRNNNQRRNHNERQNNNRERDTLGDNLRHIAHTTLEILDDGEYFPPGQDGPYDLTVKILWTNENTRYYGPGAGVGGVILESEFIAAASRIHDDDNANSKYRTRVQATVPPNPPIGPLLIILKLKFTSEITQLSSAHVRFTLHSPETQIHSSTRKLEYLILLQPRNQVVSLSTELDPK